MSKNHQKNHEHYHRHIQQACESDTEDSVLSLYLTDMFRKEAVNFHDVLKTHQNEELQKSSISTRKNQQNEDCIIDVLKECMPQMKQHPNSASVIKNEEKEEAQYQYKTVVYSQIQATGTTYVFNVNSYSYPDNLHSDNYHDNHNTNCQYKSAPEKTSELNSFNSKKNNFLSQILSGVMNVLFPDVGHPYLGVVLFMGLAMGGVFYTISHVMNKEIQIELQNNPLQSLGDTALSNPTTIIATDGNQELGIVQSSQYTLMSPKYYHDHCLAPLGNDDKKWPSMTGHSYVYNMDYIESLPVSEINDSTVIADLHDPVMTALSCQGFSHQKIDGENELFYQGKPVRFVIKSLQDSF